MKGIYSINCLANNKKYIGQTVNINKRQLEHKRALLGNYHVNKHLQSAFNKYGLINFTFEVLEALPEEATQTQLNDSEINWIKKFKTFNREKGFNKTGGGSKAIYFHFKTKEEIEIIKAKMSESAQKKKLSEEHKKNIGKALKDTKLKPETIQKMKDSWTAERRRNSPKGEEHPWYNRKHKQESLEKMSNSLKNLDYGREVICLNTKEIFPSAKRAGEKYGVDYSQIGKVCRKVPKYNSAGKHPQTKEKLKWMFYKEYLQSRGGGDY